MSFAFNFADEDIDMDNAHPSTPSQSAPSPGHLPRIPSITILDEPRDENMGKPPPEEVKVKMLRIPEMLATLPSSIAYTTTLVTSPLKERNALIPRRALFDVRMQIMSETNSSADSQPSTPTSPTFPSTSSQTSSPKVYLTNGLKKRKKRKDLNGNIIQDRQNSEGSEYGLGDMDIEQNVYEGGYKSWEGALDLARLVLERGPRKDIDELSRVQSVIELGCGTALPSLILFQHALKSDLSLYFTLCDYNASVLRLVALPNLLLVWALENSPSSFAPRAPSLSGSGASASVIEGDGDFEITPELIQAFQRDLIQRDIEITLISGPWNPHTMPKMIPTDPSMSVLILAAETIYSPASLAAFTTTLLAILRSVKMAKALVAAKRVYFGVGGSVDEFKGAVGDGGGVVAEVENSGIEGCDRSYMGGAGRSSGVGRCLMEVQMC